MIQRKGKEGDRMWVDTEEREGVRKSVGVDRGKGRRETECGLIQRKGKEGDRVWVETEEREEGRQSVG